ncbi:hypothetical protein G6F35_017018 [Rhizopus arrhizus]|nr:hypothetical protein G6F35_017018 [Rhizopus arrhizus]
MIPEDLLLFRLDLKHRPGSDIFTKYIAQDQRVVDLVTNAIFHVPAGTYVSTSTLFKDGTNYDALYIPVSSNLSGLPPIILEFQRTVNMEFLRRSTRYCLNTYDRFCSSPILVVFCTNGIASTSITSTAL